MTVTKQIASKERMTREHTGQKRRRLFAHANGSTQTPVLSRSLPLAVLWALPARHLTPSRVLPEVLAAGVRRCASRIAQRNRGAGGCPVVRLSSSERVNWWCADAQHSPCGLAVANRIMEVASTCAREEATVRATASGHPVSVRHPAFPDPQPRATVSFPTCGDRCLGRRRPARRFKRRSGLARQSNTMADRADAQRRLRGVLQNDDRGTSLRAGQGRLRTGRASRILVADRAERACR